MRLRRRRYFILRVADEPVLDIARFLRGAIEMNKLARCTLLCPVKGQSLSLTATELALAMTLPVDRWTSLTELDSMDPQTQAVLIDLVRRGVLLSDPASPGLEDLVPGEQDLEQMEWHDLAAVYHAHSRWEGVVGDLGEVNRTEAGTHSMPNESARIRDLNPPSHFVQRADAKERIPLNVPVLEGPFFETLLARSTTRAYRSQQSLPAASLEIMLYTVFGTQGTKVLAPGIAAIKRTSPSGGALHPIEAYVLVTNVQGIPAGLYHYETATHVLATLERMEIAHVRALAREFTAGQDHFAEAHALVIHVARFDRNFWKYARHRKAYKVVLMDSAHLSQTFYLTAAHLGLGAFYTSAINDVDIGRWLRLPPLREAAIGISGVGIVDRGRTELSFLPDPYELPRIV